jgi:macrolide-specific efflux system membrane fusion protein
MKNISVKNRWIGVVTLALISVAIYGIVRWRSAGVSIEGSYEKIILENGDIQLKILATGVVQPRNRLEIKPPIAGRVERIAIKEGQQVRRGQVLAWISSTERATMLDAARAQGMDELKKWEEYYRPIPIVAPIAGQIIGRRVEVGQSFGSGDALFIMADELSIKAQVDETDLAQIRLQQYADIRLDSYPDQIFMGRVVQIALEAKTVSNVTTYEIDVVPENRPDFMRSGMTANVEFIILKKENILRLPIAAIIQRGGATEVNIWDTKNNLMKPALVEIGISDGKFAEVLQGLEVGQQVMVPQVNNAAGDVGGSPFRMNRKRPKK